MTPQGHAAVTIERDYPIGSARSLVGNGLAILLSRVLTAAVSLLTVPLVISHLGLVGFGSWESLLGIAALSNLGQSAISGTLLWRVSGAYGSKDMEAVRYYTGVGMFVSLLLFILTTPIAWLFSDALVEFSQIPIEARRSLAYILPCLVGVTLLGTLGEVFGAVLAGFQRAGVKNFTQSIAAAFNYAVVFVCLALGLGFWSLLIGAFTSFAVGMSVLYVLASRACGISIPGPRVPDRRRLSVLAPYAAFMLLSAVALAMRDHADRVLLASVADPIWTGYFGIAARLAGLVPMVCTFFYVPTTAAAGALCGRNDWLGISRLYDRTMVYMSSVVGLVVVLVAGLHDQLMVVWLGRVVPEAVPILYLLLAGNAAAIMLAGVGTSVCQGLGVVRMEATYIAVGLAFNVVLKFTLIPLFGALGTVAASSLSWAGSAAVFLVYMHKKVDLPVSSTLKGLRTIVVTVLAVLALRLLRGVLPMPVGRLEALLVIVLASSSIAVAFAVALLIARVLPAPKITHWAHASDFRPR